MQYKAENIRNIAFMGHGGDGKTTLTESILFGTGAAGRAFFIFARLPPLKSPSISAPRLSVKSKKRYTPLVLFRILCY